MTPARLTALALIALCTGASANASGLRGPGTSRIHPTRTQRLPPSTALAAAASTSFQLPFLLYYGGNVMPNVKIQPVYWLSVDPTKKARIEAFYAAMVQSPHMDWLSEYDTNIPDLKGNPGTNQHIGRGSLLTGVTISPQNTSSTTSETDIIAELQRQIGAGKLPQPDLNLLYMVHIPAGITVQDPGFTSCRDYCAFHDSFALSSQHVKFGVIPAHDTGTGCDTGCGEATDPFDNETASMSHESLESITDPDLDTIPSNSDQCGSAWCDPAPQDFITFHSEIGDICADGPTNITEQALTVGSTRIVVQREWSNKYGACVTTGGDAFKLSLDPPQQQIHGPGTYTFAVKTTVPASGATPVTFGTYRLPSGVTASFSPATVQTGTDATLTVTIGSITVPTINFALYGESGRTMAITSGTIASDDFSVTPGPAVTLTPGTTANATFTTASLSGPASQTLTIQLTSKPPGVSTVGTVPTIHAGDSATVAIQAAAGTPSVQSGTLTFTLTNGAATHVAQVPINIQGDDFTAIPDNTGQVILSRDGTATFRILTTTTAGNAQQLTFTPKVLPSNVTAAFAPASLMSGSNTTVTLQGNGAVAGPGQLVITVSGPATSTDVTVQTLVQGGGCSTSSALALWPLGAAAAWMLRRRRASRELQLRAKS
jgi:uncharacterized protein (TIGR03382 family)